MGQHNRAPNPDMAAIQAVHWSLLLEFASVFLGMCHPSAELRNARFQHLDKPSCCRRRYRNQLVVHGDWASLGALLSIASCRAGQEENSLGFGHDYHKLFHLTHSDYDSKPGGEC